VTAAHDVSHALHFIYIVLPEASPLRQDRSHFFIKRLGIFTFLLLIRANVLIELFVDQLD